MRGLHLEGNSGEEALPQMRSHTKGTTHKGKDYLHPKKGTRRGDYAQRGYIAGTKSEKDANDKGGFEGNY